MPISSPERQLPFQTISVDLITDLPVSRGFDSILTVVDHGCSKAAVFLPCQKTIDAIGVALLYAERIFPFYGIPRWVISDRDPRFTAQFTKELCKQLKIDQNLSTAYHPQMDGQSERANQRVEQYLRIYSNDDKDNWADLLPLAQFTHNTWVNENTKATPFEVLIGHTPTVLEQRQETNVPEVAKRKGWLERGRLWAQAVIRSAQKMLQQRRERKKGERFYKGFSKGDQVWLEGTNLRLTHPSAKLAPRRYGPFTITDEISPVVFRLALPGHWAIHNVFHASLLTPYRETSEHGANFFELPPEMIEGEEEYEVECIVNS
jgi:hypothetical protein